MAGKAAIVQQQVRTASRGQRVQFIHLGELPDSEPVLRGESGGAACYEAIFEDGRIRILTDGIDIAAAEQTLAAARAEQRRVQIVVGQPIGIAPHGATLLAVGYAEPLFAYSIDDVELMGETRSGKAIIDSAPVLDVRLVA